MKQVIFFLRLYIWFSLRHLFRYRMRTLIVIIGIALGASVFTSVRLSIHATLSSFSNSMDRIAGRADLVAALPGGHLPENLIVPLLKHPIIKHASPVLTTYAREDKAGSEPFLLIGIDPILDQSFRKWTLTDGLSQDSVDWLELIKTPFTLVVGRALADRLGWAPGGDIRLTHTHQSARFQIVGALRPEGLALVEGGRVAITDIATFQEFTGRLGTVDRIDLTLDDLKDSQAVDAVKADLKSVIPPGVILALPSERKTSGQGMIRAYQLNLSILSFASLFVGMYLVYSLVALNAVSRRHELAILRSIGASSHSLFYLNLVEGALMGVAGWLIAIPVSTTLVKYMLQGISQTVSTLFVRVFVDQMQLDGWEIGLSFALTVCISTLAALHPARVAMRVPPKEVMLIARQHSSQTQNLKRQVAIGVVLAGLAWPLSMLPDVAGIPFAGYAAILCLFIGFALVAPIGLQGLGRWVSGSLRHKGRLKLALAGRYIHFSGTQTAISVGALITAVALFTALVIMIHSFRNTVEMWVEQTISGDLFVAGKLASINEFKDPLPQATIDALKGLDAPMTIVPNRRFSLKDRQFPFEFDAMDLSAFLRHGSFVWLDGQSQDNLARLLRGEGVIVSEVYANRTGRWAGDMFETQIKTAMVRLPILGVVRDYRTNGGVVFYPLQQFAERYFDPGWSGVRIFFDPAPADTEAALAELRGLIIERCGDTLEMISGAELRVTVLRIFDDTFAVTTVLLLIALVIAALGIATTLMVLVMERSRQLNTMFAIGADYIQIRLMILWEAVLMVFTGQCAGLACGFILSYLLVYVINRQSFGWTFMYSVNWPALGLSLPLIVITALLAAIPAMRSVFSEPPASLLRER